mmetsp:Transcript_66813/g.168715  ORF Transcript_66813/g.168715 Transcript_66813/m.168715 type:complete len:265 (+) Transcript_66813:44-838(+)
MHGAGLNNSVVRLSAPRGARARKIPHAWNKKLSRSTVRGAVAFKFEQILRLIGCACLAWCNGSIPKCRLMRRCPTEVPTCDASTKIDCRLSSSKLVADTFAAQSRLPHRSHFPFRSSRGAHMPIDLSAFCEKKGMDLGAVPDKLQRAEYKMAASKGKKTTALKMIISLVGSSMSNGNMPLPTIMFGMTNAMSRAMACLKLNLKSAGNSWFAARTCIVMNTNNWPNGVAFKSFKAGTNPYKKGARDGSAAASGRPKRRPSNKGKA